ncbi:GATOR complex protein DEPDC5 [Lamellibrachia satsuma]|nr:GATOR complex protein DEPDC5 [Lamellibrachia satsuma]
MQPKKSCSSSTVTTRSRHSVATINSSATCPQHDTTVNGCGAVKMGVLTPANIVTRRHSATDNYFGDTPADTQDDTDDVIIKRPIVGSAGSPVGHHSHYSLRNYHPHRALINPFAPRRLHLKVTSIRRRWTHAFPTDLQGMSVQPHHKHGSFYTDNQQHVDNSSPPTREVIQAARLAVELRKNKTHRSSESSDSQDNPYCVRSRSIAYSSTAGGSVDSLKDVHPRELTNVPSSSAMSTVDSQTSLTSLIPACEKDGMCAGSAGRCCPHSVGLYSRSASYHKDLGPLGADQVGHSWLWGVTGEQEWTIEIKTGMDWPSMTLPASLPLTTDYFPDKRSIQLDYVISEYSVVPENVMADQSPTSLGVGHKQATTLQVYKEMIATRIARGFQIVLQQPKSGTIIGNLSSSPYQTGTASRWRSVPKAETPEEITLSNGRIFHKLTLNGQTVTVTRYWTRHPYAQKTHHYTYRFQVPDSDTYDVSWTQFTNDKLEKYNWNHLDQYVTTRGEEGFGLIESLKYWRSRFFLLPSNNAATRRIADGETTLCDIYEERTAQERNQLTDAFLRFIEHLNRIKRTVHGRLMKVGENSAWTTDEGG